MKPVTYSKTQSRAVSGGKNKTKLLISCFANSVNTGLDVDWKHAETCKGHKEAKEQLEKNHKRMKMGEKRILISLI